MPILPSFEVTLHATLPTEISASLPISAANPHLASGLVGISPIGQPSMGFRLGLAQADRIAYFAGIDGTIPISAGIRVFAIRGDLDGWRDLNSSSSSSSAGGTAVSALFLVGPKAGYFGGGPCYAARYGGASGPAGAGVKLVYGSQIVLAIGYELSFITTSKGTIGAITVGFHS